MSRNDRPRPIVKRPPAGLMRRDHGAAIRTAAGVGSPADDLDKRVKGLSLLKNKLKDKAAARKATGSDEMPQVHTKQAYPNLGPETVEIVREECPMCSRLFAVESLNRHAAICKRTSRAKQRKVFDASAHRARGTELEQFKAPPGSSDSRQVQLTKAPKWRIQSEALREAMKADRDYKQQMAAEKAAGPVVKQSRPKKFRLAATSQSNGKPGQASSCAPVPARKVNGSLVPCPHCDRRFNDKAALRHIPVCLSIINRPKPLNRGDGRGAHTRIKA